LNIFGLQDPPAPSWWRWRNRATQRLPDDMTPAREIIRLLQAGAVILLGWAVLRIMAHISRLKREARGD